MNKILIISALSLIFFSSCDDPSTAQRILEENGYTNIELTGFKGLCCGDDDTFSTGFTAQSPNGRWVSGCVCSSTWSKGATIRFE